MDTVKLKHFCTLVETGSLTKAAKLCGITHPGIHKSIKSLECELNCELTRPDGRGITITQSGLALYEKAKEILRNTEELFQTVLKNTKEITRIGFSEIFSQSLTRQLITIEDRIFSFHERCPGDIERDIASGYLDFGVTGQPTSHSGINFDEVGRTKFVLVGKKKTNFSDAMTFITPNSLLGNVQRDHWPETLCPRKKVIKTNMLSVAIELAISGKGYLYIPYFLYQYINENYAKKNNLVIIELPESFPQVVPLYLLSRSSVAKDEFYERLKNIILKLCIL